VAAFALVAIGAHGAAYLAPRTDGAVRERAVRLARRLWTAAAVLIVPVSWATSHVRPDFFTALVARPVALSMLALVVAAVAAVPLALHRGREHAAVLASSAALAALLGGAAAAMWPVMLHSTLDPAYGLTASAAASGRGLALAAHWWPVALCLAVGYAVWVSRQHARGRTDDAGGGA